MGQGRSLQMDCGDEIPRIESERRVIADAGFKAQNTYTVRPCRGFEGLEQRACHPTTSRIGDDPHPLDFGPVTFEHHGACTKRPPVRVARNMEADISQVPIRPRRYSLPRRARSRRTATTATRHRGDLTDRFRPKKSDLQLVVVDGHADQLANPVTICLPAGRTARCQHACGQAGYRYNGECHCGRSSSLQ